MCNLTHNVGIHAGNIDGAIGVVFSNLVLNQFEYSCDIDRTIDGINCKASFERRQ